MKIINTTNMYKVFISLSAFFIVIQSYAQNFIEANPANMHDSKTIFTNPAAISLQAPHILIGSKVYHLGIVEDNTYGLRNDFLGISYPDLAGMNLDLGFVAGSFNTPVYNENHFGLQVGRQFFSQISLGLKIGLLSLSYDKSQFDLVDVNDPVFTNGNSKTALTLGLGCYYSPIPKLGVGVSVDHLNQPNLSIIGDNVKQPIIINAGIQYKFGFIRPIVGLTYFRDEAIPNFSIESYASDLGSVRFGYAQTNLSMDGCLYLIKGISMNYVYEYPLSDLSGASGGSHIISLIYNFKGSSGIKHWAGHEKAGRQRVDDLSGIYIDSEVDTLSIIKKIISQKISPVVSIEEYGNIPAKIFGLQDNETHLDDNQLQGKLDDLQYRIVPDAEKQPVQYQRFLNKISEMMNDDSDLTVHVVSAPAAMSRAVKIKNYIAGYSQLLSDRVKVSSPAYEDRIDSLAQMVKSGPGQDISKKSHTTLFPPSNRFMIALKGMTKEVLDWDFEVRNAKGKVIKTISGKDYIPLIIEWNWKDDLKELSEPGYYYYRLKWRDTRNRKRQSMDWNFLVRKIHRHITLEVGKELANVQKADHLYLYLR